MKPIISMFLLVLQLFSVLRLTTAASFSLPNCVDHCGNVQIPYPFGIGAKCYHDPSYEIICNSSFTPSKPFLRPFNLEVLDINWPGRYSRRDPLYYYEENNERSQILKVALPPVNLCESGKEINSPDLKGSPFTFSSQRNVLMMQGCGGSVVLKDRSGVIMAGCASNCVSDNANNNGKTCYGVGCCQDSMEDDLEFYEIAVHFEQQMKSNSCNASVALIDRATLLNFTRPLSSLGTVLRWKAKWIPDEVYDNRENVSCDAYMSSTTCYCPQDPKKPYEGNPYLPNGCQVVEECQMCNGFCGIEEDTTSSGSPYYYHCWKGPRTWFHGFIIGIMGAVLLVPSSYWLYRYVKRRKEIKRKAKHFKRNGGLLLQQKISSNEGVVETTKVFTIIELEKATDNFNENRILGQGGQGTVYKGMLMNGKIVAIKKAKKVNEGQVEQFINEVVILSQINHRNVVKLLGCCLETEVPVLVYEFIPNGTVYEHLQGQSEDFHVTWKMRLQIAAESAGAIAYLHSSSSAPIYHRDIKSTNILLDEKYRAKVSDFGTSKAITFDQTHVTTIVLGTYGYLDPEYFLSNQFTEKSDVYSFGVVLVELITGKKPICPTGNGGWSNLASEFLTLMEESHLFDMIDARIIDEGKKDEFIAVAELARNCLNMNGKQRPTMKEIAVQLDGLKSLNMHVSKEPRLAERTRAVTEEIYSDDDPFSKGVLFSDDDPPACSIEIKPLMPDGSF